MHGKCGATYESGSLRRYHLGRTETIRSCTLEALELSKSMAEEHNQTSIEAKYKLFLQAIQAHRQYTNDVEKINSKFGIFFENLNYFLGNQCQRHRSTSIRFENDCHGKRSA